MKRLLIINNVPSPYRTFMFNKMSERGGAHGIGVTVAFQARRESRRPWSPEQFEMRFPHFISSGINPWSRRAREFFTVRTFNTDILWRAMRGGYDWILMAPFMSLGNWLLALAPVGKTRKLLWSESNVASAGYLHGPVRWFKRLLQRPFSVVVCPGRRALEYVLHISPELSHRPILWLPNIVDTSVYSSLVCEHRARREAIRKELGVGTGETLVVGVGQMIERKGFHLLIEAVATLPGRYRVIVLGDGPRRGEWLGRLAAVGAANRVSLPGPAGPADVARHLAAADWFIHPALQDPSPLAVVEATVAGLPMAVSTQTGNSPEAVVEGENGFTFDPRDGAALLAALQRIVATPAEVRERMGRRSAELGRERFNPDVVVDRFFKGLLECDRAVHGRP